MTRCEDCISRQAVIDACEQSINLFDAVDRIKELPPVTPQPKMGHWEWVKYDHFPALGDWHCSECGCVVVEGVRRYKYCPNCGAKMVEPQESEE